MLVGHSKMVSVVNASHYPHVKIQLSPWNVFHHPYPTIPSKNFSTFNGSSLEPILTYTIRFIHYSGFVKSKYQFGKLIKIKNEKGINNQRKSDMCGMVGFVIKGFIFGFLYLLVSVTSLDLMGIIVYGFKFWAADGFCLYFGHQARHFTVLGFWPFVILSLPNFLFLFLFLKGLVLPFRCCGVLANTLPYFLIITKQLF